MRIIYILDTSILFYIYTHNISKVIKKTPECKRVTCFSQWGIRKHDEKTGMKAAHTLSSLIAGNFLPSCEQALLSP